MHSARGLHLHSKRPASMRIRIPEPCHEDWFAMTPTERGRHCAACAKTVVDFTRMTDAEVVRYLRHAGGQSVCGRARPAQLDRALAPPPLLAAPHLAPLRRGAALASLAAGLAAGAQAQSDNGQLVAPPLTGRVAVHQQPAACTTPTETPTDTLPAPEPPTLHVGLPVLTPAGSDGEGDYQIVGEVAVLPEPPRQPTDTDGAAPRPFVVEGTVRDANHDPLVGANVYVPGTSIGAATDREGRYRLELDARPEQLVCDYFGYRAQTRTLAPPPDHGGDAPTVTPLDFTLRALTVDLEAMGGAIVIYRPSLTDRLVTGAHAVKRGFAELWQRLTTPAAPATQDPAVLGGLAVERPEDSAVDPAETPHLSSSTAPRDRPTGATEPEGLLLWPNPSTGRATLRLGEHAGATALVNVYAPDGRLVLTRLVSARATQLDLGGGAPLASGRYTVELADGAGVALARLPWVVARD